MKENKQYRLKRWYPSLKKTVEVGCIITKIYTCGGYHYRGSDNEGVIFYVSGSQCENNPDFWELIEEEKSKPLFVTEDGVELSSNIVTLYAVDLDNQGIESPEWDFKECEKMGLKIFYYKKNADKYIEENKPKPLFITEDGVEVLSDIDNLYAVNLTYFNKTKNTLRHSGWLIENSAYKVFYHESNADEYIWRNKPLFSYEDFIRWGNVPYQRVIEQFAKERSEV